MCTGLAPYGCCVRWRMRWPGQGRDQRRGLPLPCRGSPPCRRQNKTQASVPSTGNADAPTLMDDEAQPAVKPSARLYADMMGEADMSSQPQPAVKPSVSHTDRIPRICRIVTTTASCEAFCESLPKDTHSPQSQPQPAVKPSASMDVIHVERVELSQPQPAVKPSASGNVKPAQRKIESQPQPAVKPSARLVFFYPYISGSARAFFPGGGQDGSQNGRFSTPSRKMAK